MLSECMRIKFRKVGRLKYISHLDLQRTFSTGLIRAGIPVWYSQGFNPHPKLVFALTVSVGAESECELLDVRLDSPIERETALAGLRRAFTEEMQILDVYTPDRKFSEIAWSGYSIDFEEEIDPLAVEKMLLSEMVVTRKTKSGEKREDIRPMVKSVSVDGKNVSAVLSAGNDAYLNPDYLVKAIFECAGQCECDYAVKRIAMYDKDMNVFK